MKFLVAVMSKTDAPLVADAMCRAGYHSTITDSYGGFLKEENAVVFCGVDDTKVADVMRIIKENTSERLVDIPTDVPMGKFKLPPRIKVGRAVVFTFDIDQFVRL